MTTYSDLILASAPIAYYKLDELSGSVAADSSGNGKDLTLTNVTLAQPGLRTGDVSTSALFAGTATSHALRNSFTGFATSAITITGIFKTPDSFTGSGMDCMVSWASAGIFDSVLLRNAMQPKLTRNAASATSHGGGFFNQGSTHIAATWRASDGRAEIWINGIKKISTNITSGTNIVSNGSLVLGQDQDSLGGGFSALESFQGYMQDIAIFNTVLSDSIIKQQSNIALLGTGTSVFETHISTLNEIIINMTNPTQGLTIAGNYSLDNGLISVSAVESSDRKTAFLTTSGMSFDTNYILTLASGITDDAGNSIENTVLFVGTAKADFVVNTTFTSERPILTYLMRAYREISGNFVWWTSSLTPDSSGTLSGFNPSELTDIIIEKKYYS